MEDDDQGLGASKPREAVSDLETKAEAASLDENRGAPGRTLPDPSLSHSVLEHALSEQNMLLCAVKQLIETRLAYDAVKEQVIGRLSEDVNLYRENFLLQCQKPLLVELIMLYDHLVQIMDGLTTNEPISAERVSARLEALRAELLEILYRRDIVPYIEHPVVLDHRLHKTVKVVPTSEMDENNRVERILKTGFLWNEKVLRAEEVVIKKFNAPKS